MMLHENMVTTAMYDLLRKLMSEPLLSEFYLAGGTSLAMQLGHRRSMDIDLFISTSFDARLLAQMLRAYPIERLATEPDTVTCVISGTKTEFLAHNYPLLDSILNEDGIRLASLRDLAAMKLNAISGRGLRKDFYDLDALLNVFPLDQMLGFFQAKYRQGDVWHLIKALTWFEDADQDKVPLLSSEDIPWEQVKARIKAVVETKLDHIFNAPGSRNPV
jgi:predicted nucleotidyltransferase component of viral defense system